MGPSENCGTCGRPTWWLGVEPPDVGTLCDCEVCPTCGHRHTGARLIPTLAVGDERVALDPRIELATLRAKLAAAEADRDRYAKHADEGWALANRRTEQWKQVEAERDEARAELEVTKDEARLYDRDRHENYMAAEAMAFERDSARRSARAWKMAAREFKRRLVAANANLEAHRGEVRELMAEVMTPKKKGGP